MRGVHRLFVIVFAFACHADDSSWQEPRRQSSDSTAANVAPPVPAESPGQRVQPTLVRNAKSALTPDEILARWTSRAHAISVFHSAAGTPFLREPSQPDSISTNFILDTRVAIKGHPPSSIVQAGGRIGDLEIESIQDGRIRVGEEYLGFFANHGAWRLIAAVKVTNGSFRVKGQPYSVASIQASLGGR
jgi:hypothetical protein